VKVIHNTQGKIDAISTPSTKSKKSSFTLEHISVRVVDMLHILLVIFEDYTTSWAFVEDLTIPIMDFKYLQNRYPLALSWEEKMRLKIFFPPDQENFIKPRLYPSVNYFKHGVVI